MRILITGCAGFIGFHYTLKHLKSNNIVVGIDNINSYYSTKLKKDRLKILKKFQNFNFFKFDLKDNKKLQKVFDQFEFNYIVHLAAQAGVRYSYTNPQKYIDSNIISFTNMIENCRLRNIKNFFYASSSSVYGNQKKFPIKENALTNPISLYGTTKLVNEEIAQSYSLNFNIKTTGLRFFTVYGPFGRPDMALYKFVNLLKKNKPIELFNGGRHSRDFTYIDDIINSMDKVIKKRISKKNKILSIVLNLASGNPKKLVEFIYEIEKNLNVKASFKKTKLQKGDVIKTFADISRLRKLTNYYPKYNIKVGIKNFVDWHNSYHK